jgi:putative sigma-54 modulation protein
MRTTIQSIHFDADIKLLQFIEQKLAKLPQLFNHTLAAEVFLKLEKNDAKGNKIVEIKVSVPQSTLVASERGRTFEEATDLCLDQMKAQLKKFKEKMRD